MLGQTEYRKPLIESEGGNRAIVSIADTWFKRFRGFKSKAAARSVDGVLIHLCSSIHTIGMRFDIDVYFLDSEYRVICSYPSVRPCRCRFGSGATCVLELRSGKVAFPFARVGEKLSVTGDKC